MRAQTMIKHSNGGRLPKEVMEEFTRKYPYLKIEGAAYRLAGLRPAFDGKSLDHAAACRLIGELGISDRMTVRELEAAITTYFGVDAQVFRKSGKFWIETRMTRDWTLKQQNDQGYALDEGLK